MSTAFCTWHIASGTSEPRREGQKPTKYRIGCEILSGAWAPRHTRERDIRGRAWPRRHRVVECDGWTGLVPRALVQEPAQRGRRLRRVRHRGGRGGATG